jgi:hypothetical protein
MHFLDEVMFELGQLFDAFALRAKLIQKGILLGRDPIHPPKATDPAKSSNQRQPKSDDGSIHHTNPSILRTIHDAPGFAMGRNPTLMIRGRVPPHGEGPAHTVPFALTANANTTPKEVL